MLDIASVSQKAAGVDKSVDVIKPCDRPTVVERGINGTPVMDTDGGFAQEQNCALINPVTELPTFNKIILLFAAVGKKPVVHPV